MKIQAARIARLDALTKKTKYRDDLPPVLFIEDSPDVEDRIALYRAGLAAQGYDPEDPLVIILDDVPKAETHS
ncbi:MAG TPA: hypothetical protein VMV44_14600 [Rectinemataceae bacterium]|nr:hypothetical protein [Rectinemataceae bacterium]